MIKYSNYYNIMKTAVITALGLIAYFLLMKLFNLLTHVEFRFLNGVIIFFGVRAVFRNYKKFMQHNPEYLPGLALGTATALITSIIFAGFIFSYLTIDSSFMTYLQHSQSFGEYLTPGSATVLVVLEGAASGVIISFIMVQYLAGKNKQSQQNS